MPDVTDKDLRGARFERVDLTGAELRACDLSRVVMRSVDLVDADITGDIRNLRINGVDVEPLVEAELDRRHPLRATMRPTDPAGFLEAWDILDRLWEETVARARRLPPELLHRSVDGEWTFVETLRHLLFATDAWIRRAVLGDPAPWHALDLPWDEMPDTAGVPRDRHARPSLDEVLDLRRDRRAGVRRLLEGLSPAALDGETEPVHGPGWPEPRHYQVRTCLRVVINEEWEHRLYAERDLDALAAADHATG